MSYRPQWRTGALMFVALLPFVLGFHYLNDGALTQENIGQALMYVTTFGVVYTFLPPLVQRWRPPSPRDTSDDAENRKC